MTKKLKVLVISSGLFANPELPQTVGRYTDLSSRLSGDVFIVENKRRKKPIKNGGFTFRTLSIPQWLSDISALRNPLFWLYVIFFEFFCVLKNQRHDVIWVSDPFNMGPIAVFMKKVFRIPVFLEVMGNLEVGTKHGLKHGNLITRYKSAYIRWISPKVLNAVDSVRLVYPSQVDFLEGVEKNNKFNHYPGYVPVQLVETATVAETEEQYILLVGCPWYLKGVDILIDAFNEIADDYPAVKLRVVGYEPNPQKFQNMVQYPDRVELKNQGVEYPEIIKLIRNCKILVLASRTEAFARVLTEAMASSKPLVASAVDGIPTYITDGKNGLLFEPENSKQLADQLRRILDDPELANRLAKSGHRYAKNNISEQCYVDNIIASIEKAKTLGEK